MAVGDLEGKIGELNGQLRMLAPILDELGKKVGSIAERLAAQAQSLKSAWHEIEEIKKSQKDGSNKVWDVAKIVIAAVIGSVITIVVAKLSKGGP